MTAYRETVAKRVVRRTVDTSAAEAKGSEMDRLVALNVQLQALPFNHNEVRRLLPMMMAEVVAILVSSQEKE